MIFEYAGRTRAVRTDADGLYRIDGVFNADWSVDVAKEGYKMHFNPESGDLRLRADVPVSTYDVQMVRSLTVSGVVLSQDNEPVSGAEVVLIAQPVENTSRTHSNVRGEFRLEVPPGSSFQLSAHWERSPPTFKYLTIAGESLTDVRLTVTSD